MGMLKRAEQEARRVISAPAKASSKGVDVEITMSPQTMQLLEKMGWEMRDKVLRKAVADGSRVVVAAAKARLSSHRSSRTGTSALWSRRIAEKRAGRRWNLHQSIGHRVKVYQTTVTGFIGARWPWGAHAHLLEHGGMFPRWGKTRTYQPPRPFLRPAAHSTRGQQQQAVLSRVKREWKDV